MGAEVTVPPPRDEHVLESPFNRFTNQLRRSERYLSLVMPVISTRRDEDCEQYCLQSTVLMLHSFFEEFLKALISQATLQDPAGARGALASWYPDEAEHIANMAPGPLAKYIAAREVDFRKDAARLKRTFETLFGAAPFTSPKAEGDFLDFVLVRNVITHQGAWPDEITRRNIRRSDLIVKFGEPGAATVERMVITKQFLVDVLHGFGHHMVELNAILIKDDRYRLWRRDEGS